MYCQKCGNAYGDNQSKCEKCGQDINETTTNIEDIEVSVAEESSEEDLLMTFVDKNQSYYSRKWEKMAKKGTTSSFNLAAFFLSILWLGYRKMYKIVLFTSLFYLAFDIVLYLIGYKYDFFNDSLDRSIGLGVAATIGFLGNHLYKNHAKHQIKLLQETGDASVESLKKRGGRSFLGLVIGLLIFLGVYVIPMTFIPVNIDAVDSVKYMEFYDYPDVRMGVLFADLFTDGEWSNSESTDQYEVVEYTGEKVVEGTIHDVSVVFIVRDAEEDVELLHVVVDDEELDIYDSNDFIDYLFAEHKELD